MSWAVDGSNWRRVVGSGATRRWTVAAIVAWTFVVAFHVWRWNRHGFSDLEVYRSAVIWWASDHALYEYSQPDATQGSLGFTYPPFAALLLTPLRFLAWPYVAQALYSISAIGLLVVIVALLTRRVAASLALPGWPFFAVVFPLSTLLEPVRETATFGQINFFLVALVLTDFLVLQGRSPVFGLLTGLATAIKLVPGIFIVYLFVSGRWKAGVVACASFLGATGLAWVIAPRDSWTYWTEIVLRGEGVGKVAYAFNQSVAGMLARLWSPEAAPRWLWLVLVLVCVVVGLWRAATAARAGDEVAGVTLAGIAGSLASPITWVHHVIWFVPAILVLIREGLRRGSGWLLGMAAVVFATVSYSLVALYDESVPRLTGALGFLTGNWDTLLLLALLVVLPWSDRDSRDHEVDAMIGAVR